MTQHTPGPWRVAFGNRLEVHGPKDEIGWPASIVYNAGLCTSEEAQANARLIAAAPDMLAALQDIMAESSRDDDDHDVIATIQGVCRAAIAKAKGGAAQCGK